MTASASQPGGEPVPYPWVDATPAEVRAALAPDSAADFDRQWRTALARAADTYDLSAVQACLEAWRRVARITAAAGGPAGYRRLRQEAAHRLTSGDRVPGAVSWHEARAELGL